MVRNLASTPGVVAERDDVPCSNRPIGTEWDGREGRGGRPGHDDWNARLAVTTLTRGNPRPRKGWGPLARGPPTRVKDPLNPRLAPGCAGRVHG